MRKKGILSFVMDLEGIMLNEMSQNDKQHMLSLISETYKTLNS